MKSEQAEDVENPDQVAGDVIGNTAYSERFVLKILLKLANLDTLKEEIKEKSFEDDICILWDMTTEKDVVLFLQKHEVLKLINFALPVIEVSRIIEIIIGIIGNMCCQKEVVKVLMKMDGLLATLIEYINTDDSLVLVQLLRLVSGCLYLANDEEIEIWMNLFASVEYSSALYFILLNSSHKDLLITALENLNTVCSNCNTEKFRTKFYTHFVLQHALDSLTAAFTEITVKRKATCSKDKLERVQIISLQIVLNFVGFENSYEMYEGSIENVITLINVVLKYCEEKLVVNKEIDTDLIDILSSTITIVDVLKITDSPEKYFEPTYNIWNATSAILQTDKNGSSFEENDREELKEFIAKVRKPLAVLMCYYLGNVSEDNFYEVIEIVDTVYEEILTWVTNEPLATNTSKRVTKYRSGKKKKFNVVLE